MFVSLINFSPCQKANCVSIVSGAGGLATAFDLAAFRLSMIAPVKKSVNYPKTVASMRGTGWEIRLSSFLVAIRQCEVIEVTLGPVGHWFLRFVPRLCGAYVFLSSGLAFVIKCGPVYYGKNETSEHVSRCPTF